MFSYVAFNYAGLRSPTANPKDDGAQLANQCLAQWRGLHDPEHFPPRLLILLASPSYATASAAADLLDGIHDIVAADGLGATPFIGCTVAAVFFDGEICPTGALLVSLSSRLLEVTTAFAPNVSSDPSAAVTSVLDSLQLGTPTDRDHNPLANGMLFTFLPGPVGPQRTYHSAELHRRLCEGTMHRLPIFGGVSSVDDPDRRVPALQFLGFSHYVDTIVAARVVSGVPAAITLNRGFKSTGEVVTVKDVSPCAGLITAFEQEGVAEEFGRRRGPLLLGEKFGDDYLVVAARSPEPESHFTLLRGLEPGARLEILLPSPTAMRAAGLAGARHSRQRSRIANPAASFSLHCAAHRRYGKDFGLDVAATMADLSTGLTDVITVGGFVDGEAGIDSTNRPLFTNWSVASLVIGDETRDRTLSHSAFSALATRAPHLMDARSVEDALDLSLRLIYDAGFPGALISFVIPDRGTYYLVPQAGIGAHFGRYGARPLRSSPPTQPVVPLRLERHQLLSASEFIADSRTVSCPWLGAASGVVSQYVVPLRSADGDVIAVLQIDLGDARYGTSPRPREGEVIDSLAAAVNATITHLSNWEEIRIARDLDAAVASAVADDTLAGGLRFFMNAAIDAIRAEMGHVRLAEHDRHVLRFAAGVGAYADAAYRERREIDFGDRSPTCEAFRTGGVHIVNDVTRDPSHRLMVERFESISTLRSAAERMGSYANIALHNNRGLIVGTVNVSSSRPWFFESWIVKSLPSIGQRVNYLVEHLLSKERDRTTRHTLESTTRRLSFLLDIGGIARRTALEDDFDTALHGTASQVAGAFHADVASLYLLEPDLNQFVLRSEHGWANPGWVGAARYDLRQGFTGTIGLEDTARYIPSISAYRAETHLTGVGKYARQIFGTSSGEYAESEAIALPLKTSTRRHGVLVLIRLKRSAEVHRSAFITTEQDVLQEAADTISALVAGRVARQDELRDRADDDRRTQFTGRLDDSAPRETFEARICQGVAESFGADRVDLYFAPAAPEEGSSKPARNSLTCRASHPPSALANFTGHGVNVPDGFVQAAFQSKRVHIERHSVQTKEQEDPLLASLEGVVVRAAVPLPTVGVPSGVLDVRWPPPRRRADAVAATRSPRHLQILGRMIAGACWRNAALAMRTEAKRRDERRRLMVEAMGAMVFQSAHRFRNLLLKLRYLVDRVGYPKTEEERATDLLHLAAELKTGTHNVTEPIDVVLRSQAAVTDAVQTRAMIESAFASCRIPVDGLQPSIKVPDGLMISCYPDLFRASLANLLDNSLEAMKHTATRTLSVEARLEDSARVRITITDTGKGMSDDEIRAAMDGFVSNQAGKGVGVLIARILIITQGGTLEMTSQPGKGTVVSITMPAHMVES